MSCKLKCYQCSGVFSVEYLNFGNALQKHEYYMNLKIYNYEINSILWEI
jgi:hypothetical protein